MIYSDNFGNPFVVFYFPFVIDTMYNIKVEYIYNE